MKLVSPVFSVMLASVSSDASAFSVSCVSSDASVFSDASVYSVSSDSYQCFQ